QPIEFGIYSLLCPRWPSFPKNKEIKHFAETDLYHIISSQIFLILYFLKLKTKCIMGTHEKPQLVFYQKMGELFYAIAAADKVVRKTEYDALKKIVTEEWKNLDEYEDSFQTD